MEIKGKFHAIVRRIKTEPKDADNISLDEMLNNKISCMIANTSDFSDKKTQDAYKFLERARKSNVHYKKIAAYQKPKKAWGSLFSALAGIPCSLLFYNIFLMEEHPDKIYRFKFNLFLFGLFVTLVIMANISFRPINLAKILKSLQKVLGRS